MCESLAWNLIWHKKTLFRLEVTKSHEESKTRWCGVICTAPVSRTTMQSTSNITYCSYLNPHSTKNQKIKQEQKLKRWMQSHWQLKEQKTKQNMKNKKIKNSFIMIQTNSKIVKTNINSSMYSSSPVRIALISNDANAVNIKIDTVILCYGQRIDDGF